MPHTRAANLRTLKEAPDFQDLLQIHNSSTDWGWNKYLDGNIPELKSQEDYSDDTMARDRAWYTTEGLITDEAIFDTNAWPSIIDTAADPPETRSEQSSSTDFCGLQRWYSTSSHDISSISFAAITRPQLSKSIYTPYGSTSLSEGSQINDKKCGTQLSSSKISRQPSSLSDGMFPHKKSDTQTIDLTEEQEEQEEEEGPPSPSAAEENERISNAKVNINKRRKIAHNIIEKKYRSRLKDGMAELRHCIPSTLKGRSCTDSSLSESQHLPEGITQSHSSGKVAILSDAVQYVRALTDRNEVLHVQLDVMQRRNNTLQKIALSKVYTNTPPTKVAIGEFD